MPQNMQSSVTGVERVIGYKFVDPTTLWEALQAPGSGVLRAGDRLLSTEGNKRLALKGDAWIRMVIIEDWYDRDLPRAVGDAAVQAKVCNKNLEAICQDSGIFKFINLNPSSRGLISGRTMADSMEAIFGAVAEDGGQEALTSVMRNLGML